MGGIGILGGSFNPVHLGHLRLAVEVRAALRLDRVELVPAAAPPHKTGHDLLPFDLRCEMIRRSISGREGLVLNTLEGEREGPSYTVDTLLRFRERFPNEFPYFILGTTDLLTLPTWHRWQEIFRLANLVAVEREGCSRQDVASFLSKHFPVLAKERRTEGNVWDLPGQRTLHHLAVTRMDISSSRIRESLHQGEPIAYLVPEEVEEMLSSFAAHGSSV
jgi:nicotinate-nucleotide adenylyltransferase